MLDSQLFKYPFLYARWSVPTSNLLRIYGIFGSIFLDIPSFVLTVMIGIELGDFYLPRWLIVSLVSTGIVLVWGCYSRLYPLLDEYLFTPPIRRDRRPSSICSCFYDSFAHFISIIAPVSIPPDVDADLPLPAHPVPKTRLSTDGDSPRNSTEQFLYVLALLSRGPFKSFAF